MRLDAILVVGIASAAAINDTRFTAKVPDFFIPLLT